MTNSSKSKLDIGLKNIEALAIRTKNIKAYITRLSNNQGAGALQLCNMQLHNIFAVEGHQQF